MRRLSEVPVSRSPLALRPSRRFDALMLGYTVLVALAILS